MVEGLKGEFLAATMCDLDALFSAIVRGVVHDKESFNEHVVPLLRARTSNIEVTDIGRDHLLNKITRASKQQKKKQAGISNYS